MSELSRRGFLMTTAAAPALAASPSGQDAPWNSAAVVQKVYLSAKRAGWPRPDMDLKQEVAQIEANLAEFERRHPGQIRFTGGEIIQDVTQMPALARSLGQADAILAFNMTTGVYRLLEAVVDMGKPTLLFSLPYSGHDWTHAAALTQRGRKIDVIASSDYGELDPYAGLFQTIHHLRHSKVLLIAPPTSRPATSGYVRQFGTSFGFPTYLDLKAAYDAVDAGQARAAAEAFMKAAVRMVEPQPEEVVNSMRLSMAMENLLRQEKANAISIDCLGGFGRAELPAYPCIGFTRLNDAGMYGVCECDLESTMTQLLVTSFSGKPGFVSDPVFDTSRNEVIHAHCVSATAMRGVGGAQCPYIIRNHLEDHKGVSLQVLLPVNETVTVARFARPDKMWVSTAEATGNVDDPRGCRTKIRTRVSNARKFLEGYAKAINTDPAMPGTRDLLHRVVFYGDHVWAVERLGRLTGYEVIREI